MSAPSLLALHEIGHTLAALHYGYTVGVVRLFAGDVDLGLPERTAGYMLPRERLGEVDPFHWTVVLLAGRAAVAACGPTSTTRQERDAMAVDDSGGPSSGPRCVRSRRPARPEGRGDGPDLRGTAPRTDSRAGDRARRRTPHRRRGDQFLQEAA